MLEVAVFRDGQRVLARGDGERPAQPQRPEALRTAKVVDRREQLRLETAQACDPARTAGCMGNSRRCSLQGSDRNGSGGAVGGDKGKSDHQSEQVAPGEGEMAAMRATGPSSHTRRRLHPRKHKRWSSRSRSYEELDRNSGACYSPCLLCWPTTNSVVSMILKSSQRDQFST